MVRPTRRALHPTRRPQVLIRTRPRTRTRTLTRTPTLTLTRTPTLTLTLTLTLNLTLPLTLNLTLPLTLTLTLTLTTNPNQASARCHCSAGSAHCSTPRPSRAPRATASSLRESSRRRPSWYGGTYRRCGRASRARCAARYPHPEPRTLTLIPTLPLTLTTNH